MKIIMSLVTYFVIVCITSQCAAGAYDHHDDHKSSSSPEVVVINLTHHHSIHSPTFLNHSQTITDRANFDFHTSLQRAASIYPRSSSSPNDYISSGITGFYGAGFYAHLEVGSRSVKQQVVMDTGSGLLWINCEPTVVGPPDPIFDPGQSTSYSFADCDISQVCRYTGVVKITCERDSPIEKKNNCKYYGRYANDKFISGTLSVENIKFVNSTQVLRVVFGCTHRTDLYAYHPDFIDANGVLGLSRNSLSILQQEDYSNFSYCISDVSSDGSAYLHSKLILGDILTSATNLSVGETPLLSTSDLHYFINLEAIYIGDYKLDFDPAITRRNPFSGGMIVDTGSTHSFLPRAVYDKLEEAVVAELDQDYFVGQRNYSFTDGGVTRLCYDGVFLIDLPTFFPTVRFVFEGGAAMELDTINLFEQVSQKTYCLAVLPDPQNFEDAKLSLMGILMQQFYYLGFDLARNKFVFQKFADCRLIGE